MDKITQKTLSQIKSQHLQPASRWQFVFRNLFFWLGAVTAVIISSLVINILFLIIRNDDWAIAHNLGFFRFGAISLSVLFPGLIIISLISLLTYSAIRFTKKGYRYTTLSLIAFIVILIAGLGIGFYFVRAGQVIDNTFQNRIPSYEIMRQRHADRLWNNPDRGLLTGEVMTITDEIITIKAPSGYLWSIPITDLPNQDLVIGAQVNIIGHKQPPNFFQAKELRPIKRYPPNKKPAF